MGTIQSIQGGAVPRLNGFGSGGLRSTRGPVAQAPAAEPEDLDPERAQALVRQVQEALDKAAPSSHHVSFRRDEATNSFVIEIRDPDGSTVRQYPPEKLLNLRRNLVELSGMVIDKVT